ncbi:MAG: hypothetical protein IJM91_01790 [Lachnospiraceae bacterium]|nr:hypothetical protein [Lachnospiraceae bacterium]
MSNNNKDTMNTGIKVTARAIALVKTYKRYFILGIAAIAFILIMFFAIGKGDKSASGNVDASGNPVFEVNKDKKIKALMKEYYDNYIEADIDGLKEIAKPISENEEGYIKIFAQYIDSYKIKEIYTQKCKKADGTIVVVELELNFTGCKTTDYGMDTFLVSADKDGNLLINNLYSQFNRRTYEYILDSTIEREINSFSQRKEFLALQKEIDEAHEKALLKDSALDEMVNTTINLAVSDYMTTIVLVQNQTPPDNDVVITDVDEPDDEPESEDKIVIDESIEVTEYAITTDSVNVRYGASKDKKSLGKAAAGAKVEILAIDPWGEWSYVQVNENLKGFIRNDFLITQDNEYTITGKDGYPEKDSKVALKETVNLMNSMKSYNKVISALQEGTQVTIIAVYQNGQVKVSVNGKTGYLPLSALDY